MPAPHPPRIRTLFHAGHIAPRSHCLPRAHRGPMVPNAKLDGWFGFTWSDCSACGSTIVVGQAPTKVAA